jgi:hypothetical protein
MRWSKAQLRLMSEAGTVTDMNPIAFILVQAATRDAVRGAGPDSMPCRPARSSDARRTPRFTKGAARRPTRSAARPAVERSV